MRLGRVDAKLRTFSSYLNVGWYLQNRKLVLPSLVELGRQGGRCLLQVGACNKSMRSMPHMVLLES